MKNKDKTKLLESMRLLAVKPGALAKLDKEDGATKPELPAGWMWVEKATGDDGVKVMAALPKSVDDIDKSWALTIIHSQLVNHGVYGRARAVMAKRKIKVLGADHDEELLKEAFTNSQKAGGWYLMEKPKEREVKLSLEDRQKEAAQKLLDQKKVKDLAAGLELAKLIITK